MLRLSVVGAVSVLAQVVLLRECAVTSFGTELVLVLALGVWLLGAASGAVLARRGHAPDETGARWAWVILGVLLPLAVVWARGARSALGGVPGADLPLERQAIALLVGLVPVSLVLGLLFRQTAAQVIRSGRSLAAAYACESAGGLAGGLVATALAAKGAPNLAGALLASGLVLLTAAASPRPAARALRLVALVALAIDLAGLVAAPPLDRWMTAWNHPQLLATRDTPYCRVTVTGESGQIVVFEDDALVYESEGTAAEEFVLLAATQRDTLRSVLVLDGAVAGLLPEVLQAGAERVDDVELDSTLIDVVAPRQPWPVRSALADARVRIVFADPRRFLERAGRYDLVLVGTPEPGSGRTNRFYTREFFAQCSAHLAQGGVLALRLRGAENAWTPQRARRAASIQRALSAVFPATVVLPGVTNLLLASRTPFERDPAVLGARVAARAPAARRVTPAYVRYLYTNDRFGEVAAILARTPAPVNRDALPACYQSTMLLWLSRFRPSLARLQLDEPAAAAARGRRFAWGLAAIVALVLGLARRRAGPHRAWLVGLAGAAGMMLECAVLLAYQTASGVLYQDLGVLLASFMAGLALGAIAVERVLGQAPARRTGVAVLAALSVLGLGCAAAMTGGQPAGLAGASIALLVCGALVAGAFAVAAHGSRLEEGERAGPLYAADLLGGCLGSLGTALYLIPSHGLAATAALAACVAAAALLFV